MTRMSRNGVLAGASLLVACGVIISAVGCTQSSTVEDMAGYEAVDPELDAQMEQLMGELREATGAEVTAQGLKSLQSTSSWAAQLMPLEEPGRGSMQVGALPEGQIVSVFGACVGAQGTAQIIVEDGAPFELECTTTEAGISVQQIRESLVLEDRTLTVSIGGVPADAAWIVEAAGP